MMEDGKMRISSVQMEVELASPEKNFRHAEELITKAMESAPDAIVLPETWNTGFFPKEGLAALSDSNGEETSRVIGGLAKRFGVNIVAGSVSDRRNGRIYNTAYVFDREGRAIASYDKTHLFSPSGEHEHYSPGDSLCGFFLDGVPAAIMICYDLRFPELCRALALGGAKLVFMPSEWPGVRREQLRALRLARAIENQCFFVNCNACGKAGEVVYHGDSAIIDPLGGTLASAGDTESIITAECDFSEQARIRRAIPVFNDRREELYKYYFDRLYQEKFQQQERE